MAHQPRSDETRSRILQAALACFSRAGFDATGVAEICAEAGVSKGAFYYHFPSKQAVFVALLQQWLADLDTQFAAVRALPISVPDALSGMALAARQVFEDARGQLPLFLEFWTQASRDPVIWENTVEPYRRYERYFADLIRAGTAAGDLRPVDPDTAARAVIALAVGLLAQALANPDSPDWPQAAVDGVELLLQGLEARKD